MTPNSSLQYRPVVIDPARVSEHRAAVRAALHPVAHHQVILSAIRNAHSMGAQEAADIVGLLMLKFGEHTEVGQALTDAFAALEREADEASNA